MDAPRTIFMGSPAAAIPVLDALLSLNWPVVGVYTAPDRPAGRGRRLEACAVKRRALDLGLDVVDPPSLRTPEAVEVLHALEPDLVLLAAYGKLLPSDFLEAPALGALNVHPSLLPKYRGAAPVQATILSGDAEAGASLIVMDDGVDTGPLVAQRAVPLRGDERAGALTERLFLICADLVRDALPRYAAGEIAPAPQGAGEPPLKRLKKDAGRLDWTRPAVELERQVRAYDPWPGAYTEWAGRRLQVLDAAVGAASDASPGAVAVGPDGPGVGTADGTLLPRRVKLEGRPATALEDFVRGHAAFVGSTLG